MDKSKRNREIDVLAKHGVFAKECLSDGKPVLADILAKKQIDCTADELDTIYGGLKDLTCEATLTQFDKEVTAQLNKISFARNKTVLQESWVTMTGEQSVKDWCNKYGVPLLWIVPKDLQKAFSTLIDVQKKNHTVDSAVVAAINAINGMDASLLTSPEKIETAFISLVGQEYKDIWNSDRVALITKTKLKIGNDMSAWSVVPNHSSNEIAKYQRKNQSFNGNLRRKPLNIKAFGQKENAR